MEQILPQNVVYRKVEEQDFEDLVRIYQDSFSPEKIGDNWQIETTRPHMEEVFKELNDQYCFVAEYEGHILGYIFAYETDMELGRELFLDIIAVEERAQGLGIGSVLWDMVMENVRENNLKAVRLIANPNLSSYEWYLKKGMQESGWVEMIIKIS